MIKEARKPSQDPVQEKLRQHKADWNKRVSTLIDNLINLKKLMNGFPSKFHMERAKITEPLPKDPTTIIGVLADDFRELATDGNQIIEEQISYSKNRRRPKPKQLSLPIQETPQPKPNPNQLNLFPKAEMNNTFIKQASGRVSRFISKLKGPWFGSSLEAEKNRDRKELLTEAAELDDMLSLLESEIISFKQDGILSSKVLLDSKILDKFKVLNKTFLFIKDKYSDKSESENNEPDNDEKSPDTKKETSTGIKTPEVKKTPEERKKELQSLKEKTDLIKRNNEEKLNNAIKYIRDYQGFYPNVKSFEDDYAIRFNDLISKFKSAKKMQEKLPFAEQILTLHKQILDDYNKRQNRNADLLIELLLKPENAKERVQPIIDQFKEEDEEVVKNGAVLDPIKRLYHKFSIFNKTSSLRLKIYDSIKQARKELDAIMSGLEKDIDVDRMSDQLNALLEFISKIKEGMNILMFKITGKWTDKQMQDFLLKGFSSGYFSEYGYDLDEKDIEKLKKQLSSDQFKKIRDLLGK